MLRVGLATTLVCLLGSASPVLAAKGDHPRLDKQLNERSTKGGKSQVIVTFHPGWEALGKAEMPKLGGKPGRPLPLLNAMVVELPHGLLKKLADHPAVARVDFDRPTFGQMSRAAVSVGARAVRQRYGYTGAGVGVAVIDSGITNWHADLLDSSGRQRVSGWKDFVNGRSTPHDDFGHGTHVAGIVGGNGASSRGAHAGVAPGVTIIPLKVLDHRGFGVISDVIAALEFAIATRAHHNIRVINMSVGAAVTESFYRDPLTLAAKRAVDAGIVVVAAAGNRGRDAEGRTIYGGITAPGNAPWVLTVGASSTAGTVVRYDDVIGGYSSRGPTAIDFQAKPDLVAPGTGIVSLADPASAFYVSKAQYLVGGSGQGAKPYLSLTGTSMAAPVVSGTVALMLQANPNLTPNMVKAILQYTAQTHADYNALTQGAGFLNSKGAVDLATYFRNPNRQPYPTSRWWGRRIIWGNQRIGGGEIQPDANAWALNIVWGTARDVEGDNIVWGTARDVEGDNIVWGTARDVEGDNIVWGTSRDVESDNIVWGTDCGGRDCFNIVWGTARDVEGDNIVWGTADDLEVDNIVWGTGLELDNIVWGTSFEQEHDNIVWGTNFEQQHDNIVWGTSEIEGDNIVWGTASGGGTLWNGVVARVHAAFEALFVPAVVASGRKF
ncbi:MAG: S8 family peptidase [Acidobacteria bacterium]|nr:S8 family peptidase [Acidobacteriota bacterium]